MPGAIVGSNADEASRNTAVWRFAGESLFDRSMELMVSSRVSWEDLPEAQ